MGERDDYPVSKPQWYQMLSYILKILPLYLLLAIIGCRQATQNSITARPPLLPEAQSQEVLRVLALTDELDKMVRHGKPGQPRLLIWRLRSRRSSYLLKINCRSRMPRSTSLNSLLMVIPLPARSLVER